MSLDRTAKDTCVRFGVAFRCAAAITMMVASIGAHAGEIHGKVVDSNGGEALGRVSVAVLDTKFRTQTSVTGEFVIAGIPAGNYTLRIEAVGYRFRAVPFSLNSESESKEFSVALTLDGFRRTETVVNVKGDVYHGEEAAVPSQMSLVGAEIKAAGTVLADDPFRAVQSLPGVSASGNNEFFGQFSVMGAPFDRVGVYVDGVQVQQPFHGLPDEAQGASLSLFSGETIDEVTLMPIAYPVKFADGAGAALLIRTREGSRTGPLFRVSLGMAESSFLAEGSLGKSNRGSWLASARKSYLGYLTQYSVKNASDVSFEDGDLKLTYDLTPRQSLDLYSIYGHTDLSRRFPADFNQTASGDSNFALARAGWRFAASPRLLVESHAAYLDQSFRKANADGLFLNQDAYGEWVGGTSVVWNWSKDNVLEAGWTGRGLRNSGSSTFFTSSEFDPTPVPVAVDNGSGT
ncbi:MAG: hypothetical protein JWO20_2754, partial [Candidatus Angelobacter sp.]|nr:hypothetical protein [Candidatus Angelobacter sp.]